MPSFLSNDNVDFPSVDEADEHGIIAIGGDFSAERLLAAYKRGIFPWPHEGLPILWFCPEPRFVLRPRDIIINRTLRRAFLKTKFSIVSDRDFLSVMKNCQLANRRDQPGTWIADEMIDGYVELHKQGFAHSIEAYDGDRLVGGLYGIALGRVFFGESMFFLEDNASKFCFVTLVAQLIAWQFRLIDCQAHTENLDRFGAQPMARKDFLSILDENHDHLRGPWHLTMTPQECLAMITKTG